MPSVAKREGEHHFGNLISFEATVNLPVSLSLSLTGAFCLAYISQVRHASEDATPETEPWCKNIEIRKWGRAERAGFFRWPMEGILRRLAPVRLRSCLETEQDVLL